MIPNRSANRKFVRAGGIEIAVCGERELPRYTGDGITHMISIQDVAYRHDKETARKIADAVPGATIHWAFFDDIRQGPAERGPARTDVRGALEFAASIREGASLLIHCHMGISRSTALAFAILCDRTGPGNESACLDALAKARPMMLPNPLIVALADQILDRKPAMMGSLMKWIRRQTPGLWRLEALQDADPSPAKEDPREPQKPI